MENKIRFDFDKKKNEKVFSSNNDVINLYLKIKDLFNDNSKEIIVFWEFQMSTKSYYYTDKFKEFDITMNLNGLISKYQITIPVKSTANEIINKYQTNGYKILLPSESLYKRGVYIVDYIFNGLQIRSLTNIGNIIYMMKIIK